MNHIFKTIIFVFTFTSVLADDEVVITGSRLSDFYDMPSVTLTKTADFLVQKIRLINDSRSPSLRKSEIIESINNLLHSSSKAAGIEISYGEGFLSPVKLDDDSIQLLQDRKKRDTSYVDIYVKVSLNKNKSVKQQISTLRNFISQTNLVSRTELEERDDIGLSIINPQQYRYEIIKMVKKETIKTRDVLGDNCEILIAGLEGRVQWGRSAISELTLYIGYATEITCK